MAAVLSPAPTPDVSFKRGPGDVWVHDWRTWIGPRTAALWPSFPEDVRMALAADAQEMADREEWD